MTISKLFMSVMLFMTLIGILSCSPQNVTKESIAKILKENPEILTDAIEANPADFMEAVQKAAKNAQKDMAKRREEAEKKKLEEAYKNPLKPQIRSDESFRGAGKDAPIVLVEYSDFECPYCTRGYSTVMELLVKYSGKIGFVYKHLPLSFHQNAMIASKYYEAIRLQDEKKAYKFHDLIYDNQRKLKNGEKFLKAEAKKLGLNMKKLAKDIKSKKVQERIDQDLKEAAKYGFQGTPGFLINGIPVKGAYPTSHFEDIIKELKKRGLKL